MRFCEMRKQNLNCYKVNIMPNQKSDLMDPAELNNTVDCFNYQNQEKDKEIDIKRFFLR